MALVLLHEYTGGERFAQVYKWANGLCYEVHMTDGSAKSQRDFNTEHEAEDFAEDWVSQTQEQKKPKNKKNNDGE